MSIPFTDQELKRAWRQLASASQPARDGRRHNPHRLLLFYAVECGLKAVWLRHHNKTLFTQDDVKKTGHDLTRILDKLRAGRQLELPANIQLSPVRAEGNQALQRNGTIESLHQIWRYGGECLQPVDDVCEQQLERVLDWIMGELQ